MVGTLLLCKFGFHHTEAIVIEKSQAVHDAGVKGLMSLMLRDGASSRINCPHNDSRYNQAGDQVSAVVRQGCRVMDGY